jgi:hypothetical protein
MQGNSEHGGNACEQQKENEDFVRHDSRERIG